jgi:coenzyme F420-reducing hydrogenase delta subunit
MAVHGHRCWCCRVTYGTMNVHHLTYARWRNPMIGDVRVLCKACHSDVTALQRARGKSTDPVIVLGIHRQQCKRGKHR